MSIISVRAHRSKGHNVRAYTRAVNRGSLLAKRNQLKQRLRIRAGMRVTPGSARAEVLHRRTTKQRTELEQVQKQIKQKRMSGHRWSVHKIEAENARRDRQVAQYGAFIKMGKDLGVGPLWKKKKGKR